MQFTISHNNLNALPEIVQFIINPISGSGKGVTIPRSIERIIDKRKFIPQVLFTTKPGDASMLARKAVSEGIKYVVAVGGDGTVNEVARELVNTNTALGIIPKGSGNGLARHLGISMVTDRALSVLNNKKIIKADYGILNGTPFFCTAGIGFDALVGDKFAKLDSRGFSNYIKTILLEYFNYKPTPYRIKINNQIIEKEAFLITIANASQWGNNAYIAPQASVQDGKFNVTIMSPFPMILAPTIGIQLFTKQITHSHFVEHFDVDKIEIERPTPDCVHVDGEPLTMNEVLVAENKHLALNVLVP